MKINGKSLTLSNLQRQFDKPTAEHILQILQDRPKVKEGEKYLYVDHRILRAPYGVISLHEIKHACKQNLSGAAWGVYCYLIACCSGRVAPHGTEVGGRQIMQATGYSKATVYRAVDKLIEAKLIEASTRTMNRKAWKLCNPDSNAIQDEATELALQSADREKELVQHVNSHNAAVNNPVNKPVNNLNTAKENRSKSLNTATSISTDSNLPITLIGGIEHQPSWTHQEYALIKPYLDILFVHQVEHHRGHCSDDVAPLLTEAFEERSKAYSQDDHKGVQYWDQVQEDTTYYSHRAVTEIWILQPYQIADDLTNRRMQKSSLLRQWRWAGTESTKKVGQYIAQYALELREKYKAKAPFYLSR